MNIDELRTVFRPGARIVLESMDDPQSPPIGAVGTVLYVDDAGQIHVSWESGGSLSLIPGVDLFHIL